MEKENTKKTNVKNTVRILRVVAIIAAVMICLVLIPILVLNVVVAIIGYARPNEIPSVFGYSVLVETTDTNSESGIKSGDLVFIRDDAEIASGNVVAVRLNGVLMLRHVENVIQTEKGTSYELTLADKAENELVAAEDVLGDYKTRIAGLGNILMFSQTPVGIILFIGGPALLFVLYDVIEKSVVMNREKNRRQAHPQQNMGAAE